MIVIIGIVMVVGMVFGGYMLGGGQFGIILAVLPYEMMMIVGAAFGAFMIGNSFSEIKHTLKDLGKIFKGPKWQPDDYRDLLCLLFLLVRIVKQNPVEIEQHIEDPENSVIFGKYPKILQEAEAVNLICDTIRSASMNYDDPHQVEEVLEKRIAANLHHALHSSHALRITADALPALGIVAAVLGVIKTMASIDQPPEILGKMIGGALVGTFLGIFLSYCFVGPCSGRLEAVIKEDAHFYQLIREVLVANLHNHSPAICIEVGRQNTPSHIRPGFADLEEALKAVKQGVA